MAARKKFLIYLSLFWFFFAPFCWSFCKAEEQIKAGDVVINEIMWMGTTANSADEWIEFHNNKDENVDLSGWGIYEQGGEALIESLSGTIQAKGFYLIERTDDSTINDIDADQTPSSWGGSGLNNDGEYLQLKDNLGNVIDEVDATSGWPAGDNSSPGNRASMERQNGSWVTNDGVTICGKDAGGNDIKGTPGSANSAGRQSTPTPTVTSAPEPTEEPEPTATPEPEPPTNTPTPKPTKKPSPSPTPEGEILGEEKTEGETTFLLSELGGGEESEEATEEGKEKKSLTDYLPQLMIGAGAVLIIGAALPFLYPRVKSKFRNSFKNKVV